MAWFGRTRTLGLRDLRDELDALKREVTNLRHDSDELAVRFRRWQGRVAKVQALDAHDEEEGAPHQSDAHRIVQLRRNHRPPFRGD